MKELDDEIAITVAAIQDFAAEHGRPPTFRQYLTICAQRGAMGPEWFRKRGISYTALLNQAGFERPNSGPPAGVPQSPLVALRRMAERETTAYIESAKAQDVRKPTWAMEWPLACLPSSVRTQVMDATQRDGSVVRITRVSASLR